MLRDIYKTEKKGLPPKESLKHWLTYNKYSDLSYGLRPLGGEIKLVTGLGDGDDDLPNLPLPVYLEDEAICIVDIRKFSSKKSFSNDIQDILLKKGLGLHYVKSGLLLMDDAVDNLSRDIIKIMTMVIVGRLRSSLSLDAVDSDIASEAVRVAMTKVCYPDDTHRGKSLLKSDGIKYLPEHRLNDYLDNDGSMYDTFHMAIIDGECSERLKNLDNASFIDIIKGLTFGLLVDDLIAGLDAPALLPALLDESYTNPLFKRTGLAQVLTRSKNILGTDDFIKKLKSMYKSYGLKL